jgi:hypothetical protein
LRRPPARRSLTSQDSSEHLEQLPRHRRSRPCFASGLRDAESLQGAQSGDGLLRAPSPDSRLRVLHEAPGFVVGWRADQDRTPSPDVLVKLYPRPSPPRPALPTPRREARSCASFALRRGMKKWFAQGRPQAIRFLQQRVDPVRSNQGYEARAARSKPLRTQVTSQPDARWIELATPSELATTAAASRSTRLVIPSIGQRLDWVPSRKEVLGPLVSEVGDARNPSLGEGTSNEVGRLGRRRGPDNVEAPCVVESETHRDRRRYPTALQVGEPTPLSQYLS